MRGRGGSADQFVKSDELRCSAREVERNVPLPGMLLESSILIIAESDYLVEVRGQSSVRRTGGNVKHGGNVKQALSPLVKPIET